MTTATKPTGLARSVTLTVRRLHEVMQKLDRAKPESLPQVTESLDELRRAAQYYAWRISEAAKGNALPATQTRNQPQESKP